MTDEELTEIISEGIVDGTDMDCTVKDQARAVLKALRDAGITVEWLPPKGRPDRYRCFGLVEGDWLAVQWDSGWEEWWIPDDNGDEADGQTVEPIAFRPIEWGPPQ